MRSCRPGPSFLSSHSAESNTKKKNVSISPFLFCLLDGSFFFLPVAFCLRFMWRQRSTECVQRLKMGQKSSVEEDVEDSGEVGGESFFKILFTSGAESNSNEWHLTFVQYAFILLHLNREKHQKVNIFKDNILFVCKRLSYKDDKKGKKMSKLRFKRFIVGNPLQNCCLRRSVSFKNLLSDEVWLRFLGAQRGTLYPRFKRSSFSRSPLHIFQVLWSVSVS